MQTMGGKVSNDAPNLLGLDRTQLIALFKQWDEPSYRATQLMQWLHHHMELDFSQITPFSKRLRTRLQTETAVSLLNLTSEQRSADGTQKWLFELDDGNAIETVYIPEADRGTLCISSQVGCALDCRFCATAQQGFNRNLKAWEIVAQVWMAKRALAPHNQTITNIVYMGMGEPLLNTQQVGISARILLDDYAYAFSKRRVTVSTAGVAPMIEKLMAEADVSLAISLHAPDDPLRNRIMSINKRYPISELMQACKQYLSRSDQKRHILFEYVMLKDVNDSPKQAHMLAQLIRHLPCKVNLIPFNPFPGSTYRCSSRNTQLKFQTILNQYNIRTLIRKTRGEDIDAACGQLAGNIEDRTKRSTIHWQAKEETLCP